MISASSFGAGKELLLLLPKEAYEWGDIVRLSKYSYTVFTAVSYTHLTLPTKLEV